MLRRLALSVACAAAVAGCSGSSHHAAGAGRFGAAYLQIAGLNNAAVTPALARLSSDSRSFTAVQGDLSTVALAKQQFDTALMAAVSHAALQPPLSTDVSSLLAADGKLQAALRAGEDAVTVTALSNATPAILAAGETAHSLALQVRRDLGLPPPPDAQLPCGAGASGCSM